MRERNLRWLILPSVCWGILLGFALILASPATVVAENGEAGQVDEFLRYGVSVRSLGMGQAYVALADDASSLYYNPAGLMRMKRGLSVYGMHFKPFYESNYNAVSFAINRPDSSATGVKGFFFGPNSAWGASFVHLGSDGYEMRDAQDNIVGENFGLYQYALMLGFARERSSSAGILGYGATFKIIRHGISGEYNNSDGSFGLDVGVQWQMINPPLIKELTRVPLIGSFFQLKHLIPLRLGVSIRNVISPSLGYGGESDEYPTALRVGGSYCLPSDWLLKNSQFRFVSDFEWLFDDIDRLIHFDRRVEVHSITPGAGQYFGTEFQYQTEKIQLSPRFGLSHVYDEWEFSTGLGLSFEASGYDFQFDFAHGFHEELVDDQRISLTIRFGGKRDAKYFAGKWLPPLDKQPKTKWPNPCLTANTGQSVDDVDSTDAVSPSNPTISSLVRVLALYPDQKQEVLRILILLAHEHDTVNADRYIDLIGGPSLAVNIANNAIAAFQNENNGEARDFARDAIDEFQKVADTSQQEFKGNNYFNVLIAQCEMINAVTDNDVDAWSRAEEILDRTQSDINCQKLYFLIGTCYLKQGNYTKAAEQFRMAVDSSEGDSQSMTTLARLYLGKALLKSERPDSAISVLQSLTNNPSLPIDSLDANYPRYWQYNDRRIPDNAQYLIAECYEASKDSSQAAAAAEYLKVCRFYPGSDLCNDAKSKAEELIK